MAAIVTVLVIVGIAIALVFGGFFETGTSPGSVTLSSIEYIVDYTGVDAGYLSGGMDCPHVVQAGSGFSCTLQLTSNAVSLTHSINGIVVQPVFSGQGIFTIQSTSPALPVSIGPGQSVTIIVSINAPGTAGSYSIGLNVETS